MSATLVPFEALRENTRYFEEFQLGESLIPCSVVKRFDAEHIQMYYGKEVPWMQNTKKNAQFRYWNDVPTESDRAKAAWN